MYNFTTAQSSAIASIEINENEVTISYQSNPDRSYTFATTSDIISEIEDRAEQVLMNSPMVSMGRFVAELIADGNLRQVELSAA